MRWGDSLTQWLTLRLVAQEIKDSRLIAAELQLPYEQLTTVIHIT